MVPGTEWRRALACLAAALMLALLVRGVAVGVSQALGPLWPFSLAHCSSPAAPGCDPATDRTVGAPAPTR